jgi:hypothetical protein
MRRLARCLLTALVGWGLLTWAGVSHAGLRYCDKPSDMTAGEQDQLFRLAAVIKNELDASGQKLALVSRSGLDLSRFAVRYSHAGVTLKDSSNTPWSVRQLYFACDENRPKIFDQGISGFLLGGDPGAISYVSVVFLPDAEAARLEAAALDNKQVLQVLSSTYSANAYPFSPLYQNCNQWVMELMAVAWGQVDGTQGDPRVQAQRWLREQGYEPKVFEVRPRPLMWVAPLVPWLHNSDHPQEDLSQQRYQVSMPSSIEDFVHRRMASASRVEFCKTAHHMVIHRGWDAIAEGCVPGAQDTVMSLD